MKKAAVILGLIAMGGNLLLGAEDFTEDLESPFSRNLKVIAWYLPNRMIDLVDVSTLELGAGAGSALDVKVTDYGDLGWYQGRVYTAGTGYCRQWGFGRFSGYQYHVGCFSDTASRFKALGGDTETYKEDTHGFSVVDADADCYLDRNVDLWALGARAGVLIDAGVYLHPVELADFITGWFGFDLTGDDFKK